MNRRNFEPRLNPRRRPVAYGLLVGTSFVGVAWLTDPAFVYVGLGSEPRALHLIFLGTFFAVCHDMVHAQSHRADVGA